MPEAILTILKFCFLALLYLFLMRVVRVVWFELGGGRPRTAAPAGPAPAPRRGRRGGKPLALKVVAPTEMKGRRFEIGEELTVGRAATCGISLPDDNYVSQVHARIFRRNGDLYLEDMGSTNGTFLNRRKVTVEMPVQRGDQIQVGRTVMELSR